MSHWCHTMPLIQILSSILHAHLFHHPPATCSPSHLTASATLTHQKALLDQEVPISSQVRMSFGIPWLRHFRSCQGLGSGNNFVLPPDCSCRSNCWMEWTWNVIYCDCLLYIVSQSFWQMLKRLRTVVILLLEVPGWDAMITMGGKLRREAGVPGHLLSNAAHPNFWHNSWKRGLARPKLGT